MFFPLPLPLSLSGALGLFSFGFTTTMFMLSNMKIIADADTSFVYTYALFFGGVAQLLTGILEYQRRNTFGVTVFCSFGCFWIGFGFYGIMILSGVLPQNTNTIQGALCLWGIFAFLMWCCTFATNLVICTLFFLLFLLFFLLAGGLGRKHDYLLRFAAAWGWLTAAVAYYAAFAASLEDAYGTSVLPVWPLKPINAISGGFIGTKRRTDRDIPAPQDVEINAPMTDPINAEAAGKAPEF